MVYSRTVLLRKMRNILGELLFVFSPSFSFYTALSLQLNLIIFDSKNYGGTDNDPVDVSKHFNEQRTHGSSEGGTFKWVFTSSVTSHSY